MHKKKYVLGVPMVKELQYLTPTEFKCFRCKHKYVKEVIFLHSTYCDGLGKPFSLREDFCKVNLLNGSVESDMSLKKYVPVLGFNISIIRFFSFVFYFCCIVSGYYF